MKIAIAGLILAVVLTGCRSQHTRYINLYVDGDMFSEENKEQSADVDTGFVANGHNIQDALQTTYWTHEVYKSSNVYDIDSPKNFVSIIGSTQSNQILDTPELSGKQYSGKSGIETNDSGYTFSDTFNSVQYISDLNQKLQTQDLVIDSLQRTINDLHLVISKKSTNDFADSAFVSQNDFSQIDSKVTEYLPQNIDSIPLLVQQQHQQQTVQKTDTIYIISEVPALQTTDSDKKFTALQLELNEKKDSINQLKKQLTNLQASIQKTDTDIPVREMLFTQQEEMNSVLIIAYYIMGKTIPENEDSILNQIKNIADSKTIEKIIISGHTDRSENTTIDNELTTARLNYIHSIIQTLISADKIYLQNLSVKFASDKIINEERRIEIRIFLL